MKRLSAVIAMSAFLGFAVPAAAHDMAEGIVSDEIWTMINDLLEAVDSPHLDLDLSFITMDRTITTTDKRVFLVLISLNLIYSILFLQESMISPLLLQLHLLMGLL